MTEPTVILCTRRAALLWTGAALAHLSGCGGDTDVAGLSTGGTGSFTSGTVMGLGSIIVNGIRFHMDQAVVVDADGTVLAPSELALGQVIHIQSSAIAPPSDGSAWPTATAHRIVCESGWIGPVAHIVNTEEQNSFMLLGKRVNVLSNTLFAGAVAQFSDLTPAHFVEVHGILDAGSAEVVATRVDVFEQSPRYYKISQLISQIDLSELSSQLGKTLSDGSLQDLLKTGLDTRIPVQLRINPDSSAQQWAITSIRKLTDLLPPLDAGIRYHYALFGSVTGQESLSNLRVNGLSVDVQQIEPLAPLSLGTPVQLEGVWDARAEKLLVTTLQIRTRTQMAEQVYEFYGQLNNITDQTFSVKGETISHTNAPQVHALKLTSELFARVRATRLGALWQLVDITVW